MKNILNVALWLSGLLWAGPVIAQQTDVSSVKIWDKGRHNAFTDLIYYRGAMYCTFREAPGHVPRSAGDNGKIRVIKSVDGKKWESVALLEKAGYDLRDSKLSVMPDGRLMVLMGGSVYENGVCTGRLNHVSFFSDRTRRFTSPLPVKLDPAIRSQFDWLWRLTWHKGTGYGVVYRKENKKGSLAYLVKTKNGIDYSLVYALTAYEIPGEATVAFLPGDEMAIVLRRDAPGVKGIWGLSKPPYQDWTWNEMQLRLGGPALLQTSSGQLLLGTRSFDDDAFKIARTSIYSATREGATRLLYTLESGGDTSYPGMIEHDGYLWVSYYSSHEGGKTNIYLAKIPVEELNKNLNK